MSGISTTVAADGADQPSTQELWRRRLSRAIASETPRALLPSPLLLHSGAGGGALAARFAAIRSRRERRAVPLVAVITLVRNLHDRLIRVDVSIPKKARRASTDNGLGPIAIAINFAPFDMAPLREKTPV
jgi:hypothetical protein